MEINIAICDDNIAFIHEIKNMINQFSKVDKNSYNIYSFTSGDHLIEKIKKQFKPDIIFLDIDLNETNLGTSLGREIKIIAPEILLIYISGYSCYYKELVVAEPFSFIEKPLNYEEVIHNIQNANKRLYYLKQKFFFTYKSSGTTYKIDLKNVMYFESQHRVINIHMCTGDVFQFYEKLDIVEKEVEEIYPYFLRINKSYYVNYYYVEKFSNSFITIRGNDMKISSKYKKRYMDKMHILL